MAVNSGILGRGARGASILGYQDGASGGTTTPPESRSGILGRGSTGASILGGRDGSSGSSVAFVPIWHPPSRRTLSGRRSSIRLTRVVPPQELPPAPALRASRRRPFPVRARGRQVIPLPGAAAPLNPLITFARRPAERMAALLRRTRPVTPVPAQIPVPPTIPQATHPAGRRIAALMRGHKTEPPWGQAAIAPNPPIVLPARTPRRVLAGLRRGRTAAPVPQQDPAPTVSHRRTATPQPRRARAAVPPLPQQVVNPPIVVATRPGRRLLTGLARGHQRQPVPAQIPVPPRTPDRPTQRRALRGWLRIAGKMWRYISPPPAIPPSGPADIIVTARARQAVLAVQRPTVVAVRPRTYVVKAQPPK